jgi:hypothetical protein
MVSVKEFVEHIYFAQVGGQIGRKQMLKRIWELARDVETIFGSRASVAEIE